MQNIHKHPMVTATEAATALGIDSRTVREKLSTGEWKGEKKKIGLQEKWFMYRGELDRQLSRLQINTKDRVSTQGIDGFFDARPGETSGADVDAEVVDAGPAHERQKAFDVFSVEQVLEKIAEQFSKQLTAEKEVIFALKRELDDKDRQLRLLPDLQKQAEDRAKQLELEHVEKEALKKQVAALQQELQVAQQPWWKKMLGS